MSQHLEDLNKYLKEALRERDIVKKEYLPLESSLNEYIKVWNKDQTQLEYLKGLVEIRKANLDKHEEFVKYWQEKISKCQNRMNEARDKFNSEKSKYWALKQEGKIDINIEKNLKDAFDMYISTLRSRKEFYDEKGRPNESANISKTIMDTYNCYIDTIYRGKPEE